MSVVFDGTEYLRLNALELREYLDGLAGAKEAVLVCWDAPLTGPFDPDDAGSHRFDFTKRPIERFFPLDETGFKTPKGISVQGYAGCQHWTISRSLLGLPRVGPYDKPENNLPFRLVAASGGPMRSRKSVVEMQKVRGEMWKIVLERSGYAEDLPRPETDDQFDAAVGFILGKLFVLDGTQTPRRCLILGCSEFGALLLPNIPGLADAWMRWKVTEGIEPVAKNRLSEVSEGQPPMADGSDDRVHGVKEFVSDAGAIVGITANSAFEAATGVAKKTADATGEALGHAKSQTKKALAAATSLADGLLGTAQGLLASSLATDLSALLASTVSGPTTIYDKAMDAEYLQTFIGGGNHRIFDGGHTIAGAWQAVQDASPDDTIIQEAMGFLDAMFKDLVTPKGLPIANWDKETYDLVSGFLQSNFGIPKDWFYDLNNYDAPELLAGTIGATALVLSWDERDTEKFAKLVGGMGVSAAISANPLLLTVTIISLARAFQKAELADENEKAVDGLLKGGIGAGSALFAASQVAVFGGPAGMALLAGLSAGMLANRATKSISVVQLQQFVMERTTAVATEIKAITSPAA
ncbi:MAG: hypothetical protein OXI17_02290 [Gammaproteobacteria bacterium]|nr:hypothetical protein [Gammaproteobacteria bacterium]